MKEKIIKYLKIILILVILEVIFFNITSYRTFFGNFEKEDFFKENFEIIETDYGWVKIKINNINSKVGTIKTQIKDDENSYEYFYEYSDETTEGHFGLPSKLYIPGEEKTQYIPCFLSGNVKSLILNIENSVIENEQIEKIIINETIPIEINLYRVLILFIIVVMIEFFKKSKIMNSNYDYKNLKQEIILIIIMIIFLSLIFFIISNSKSEENLNFYNQGLVDAILDGNIYLSFEPSEEFLQLENPYDALNRDSDLINRDEDYLWDAAYYNGKFYVYFGILPVLVIFLPFYLITGKYLTCSSACLYLSLVIILLLKEILIKLYKMYFKEVPFKLVVFSLITLYSGSLIIYLNGCIRFYEVAIISGICLVLLGIFFILKSLEKSEKKYKFMTLSTLSMALSVACRPTNIIASVILIPFLWNEFISSCKKKKEIKKEFIKCIMSIVIPYVIVAISLMWYNYCRFGNIFEFGARYQITINNMAALGSRIFTIPVGLLCNLFSIPNFKSVFPYITNHNKLSVFYGYYYIEDMIGGLFILAPICFMCIYIFKIYKKIDRKELKKFICVLLISGVLIASVSAAMGGSVQRYLADYAWMIVLAGILIFNILYQKLETRRS